MPKPTKAPEVKRLHEKGLTARQISQALGLSTQGVHYHLRRLGLAPNSPDEVAS